MKKLSEIFDVQYPSTMILNQQTLNDNGVNFVSSKGTNNGIAARILDTSENTKYKAGAITVAMKGSVLSTFLQPEDFYIAHQIAILYPKEEMSDATKLFYCIAIESNKYRFNYGRQADRTLRELLLPADDEIPDWVNSGFTEVVESFRTFIDEL